MNGFQVFAVALAVGFVTIRTLIDRKRGREINYPRVGLNIAGMAAIIAAAGLIGTTVVFQQSLILKAILYIVIPAAVLLICRYKPHLLPQTESATTAAVTYMLATFAAAVAG